MKQVKFGISRDFLRTQERNGLRFGMLINMLHYRYQWMMQNNFCESLAVFVAVCICIRITARNVCEFTIPVYNAKDILKIACINIYDAHEIAINSQIFQWKFYSPCLHLARL